MITVFDVQKGMVIVDVVVEFVVLFVMIVTKFKIHSRIPWLKLEITSPFYICLVLQTVFVITRSLLGNYTVSLTPDAPNAESTCQIVTKFSTIIILTSNVFMYLFLFFRGKLISVVPKGGASIAEKLVIFVFILHVGTIVWSVALVKGVFQTDQNGVIGCYPVAGAANTTAYGMTGVILNVSFVVLFLLGLKENLLTKTEAQKKDFAEISRRNLFAAVYVTIVTIASTIAFASAFSKPGNFELSAVAFIVQFITSIVLTLSMVALLKKAWIIEVDSKKPSSGSSGQPLQGAKILPVSSSSGRGQQPETYM